MEFLSNLSMMQRAAGAAIVVLVLVLLLVKQRQAKSAPAAVTPAPETPEVEAKRSRPGKRSEVAAAPSKGRSFGKGRSKTRGKDKGERTGEPVADPRAASARMVPRLPAAHDHSSDPMEQPQLEAEPTAFDATVRPADERGAEPSSEAMISEPGWPTPGEVWTAPGGAPAPAAVSDELWEASTNGVGDSDDAMTALTEATVADAPSWDASEADTFDPATGWGEPDEVEEDVASWTSGTVADQDGEQLDWAAGDALDGWATTGDAEESANEIASAEAAWEAPEDEPAAWVAPDGDSWEPPAAQEPSAAAADVPAPMATAVASPEGFSVTDWEPPAIDAGDDGHGSDDEIHSGIVWEPLAEETPEPTVEETGEPMDGAPMAEIRDEPESEPVAVEASVFEPVAVVEPEPVAVEASVFEPEPLATIMAGASIADPVSRWASMTPSVVEDRRPVADPAVSWARLRPGRQPAPMPAAVDEAAPHHAPAASPVAVALAPSAGPSVAWWDVPSEVQDREMYRGRFALGGYALQPGHQVVSGVTFRDAAIPPPAHWVIGPVIGEVAPGTLVLEVDGCLNCRPQDLAVLTEVGFAPTPDGFSLKLTASEQGPFAASGTYRIT